MAEGLEYWTRWQVPVCALMVSVPAVGAALVICRTRRTDHLAAADLWVPCWRSIHPLWLLAYRAVVFVAMSLTLSLFLLRRGVSALYFYTQWTFALVTVYFALGTLISAHGCWSCSREPLSETEERIKLLEGDLEEQTPQANSTVSGITNNTRGPLTIRNHQEQRAGFWGYMMQIIYQTCAGAVMLTDVVFWTLIFPFLSNNYFSFSLLKGCMHSLNVVFLLVDTSLNSMPFPVFRMAYFVLWTCAYVLFQWILHICGVSLWPYPFLEPATPWAPLWYLCLALLHIPCYGLYVLLANTKDSFFSKLFPQAYIN